MENTDSIVNLVSDFMKKNNNIFFAYAFRKNFNEYLIAEKEFIKLLEWINRKIEKCRNIENIFNPADNPFKLENEEIINEYLKNCKDLAIILSCKSKLCDTRCTVEMRENISKFIIKYFQLIYSNLIDCYI